MYNSLKVRYGENEYIVKLKEHNGWITVKLHSTKFPFRQLNKNFESVGFYLRGKKQLIKDAIAEYEQYKKVVEEDII